MLGGLLLIASLGLIVIYFLFERDQLKRARKAQEQLGGLLINAQEQERSRLAAEIHDDFSQRLAVLSLGLETAAEQIPEPTTETNRQMQELMESASELGADLHALSHQLHSSTLERLGLAAGVGSFCKEFNAQHGTQVAFSHRSLPPSVSPEIALCLFRIVQEGLRNVQKHSGAAHAEVSLELLVRSFTCASPTTAKDSIRRKPRTAKVLVCGACGSGSVGRRPIRGSLGKPKRNKN